nr:MAG TPA: hypothetical protein [Caudoviricetes sp.]
MNNVFRGNCSRRHSWCAAYGADCRRQQRR